MKTTQKILDNKTPESDNDRFETGRAQSETGEPAQLRHSWATMRGDGLSADYYTETEQRDTTTQPTVLTRLELGVIIGKLRDENFTLESHAQRLADALKRVSQFNVQPELSDDDLDAMACGSQIIKRNDKAKIRLDKTPFRDNAHALKTAIDEARETLADWERSNQ